MEKFVNEFYKNDQKKTLICRLCRNEEKRLKYKKNNTLDNGIIERKELSKQGLKRCTMCKLIKSISDFRVVNRKKGPFHYFLCNICSVKYEKEVMSIYRQSPAAIAIRRQRVRRNLLTLSGRMNTWIQSALRRGMKCDLTLEYLQTIPLLCHYTGKDLTFETNCYNTISLDRINSNDGYVKGNVVFCCARINNMKSDLTVDEFKSLCKAVAKHMK